MQTKDTARVLSALLFLIIGCSQWNEKKEETTRLRKAYLSLVEEKRTVDRENRQMRLDLELSDQDSMYTLINLSHYRIHLKMRGVPLKNWEIRHATVSPGSEEGGADRWLKRPLTLLDKKEVAHQDTAGGSDQGWNEVTISDQTAQDTIKGQTVQDKDRAVQDTIRGVDSLRTFNKDPNNGLPTSYDLYTDRDIVISVRTEKDLSSVSRGFSAWATSIIEVVEKVLAKLTGRLTSDRVQVVLDENDARSIFRSLQVGTRIILVP